MVVWIAATIVACATTAHGFTVGRLVPQLQPSTTRGVSSALREKKEADTFVSSVFNKELAFDEKSGRFFETGYDDGDCIPEEEFCMVDKESGNLIRLTIQEKERIFIDSLQVRRSVFRTQRSSFC